jgi:bacterioferritin
MVDKAEVQNNELIPLLKQALTTELTVSNHYWGRAKYWKGRGVAKLGQMYEKEADEERGHATLVADRMVFLGTDPDVAPQKVEATAGTLKQQFSEDLEGEVEVANQYRPWVQKALDQKDFVTMDILKRILLETEEHADWLQNQLEMMDSMGEQNYFQTWMPEHA